MGHMKIELDIPEFKHEISIEITLRKDGKVTCQTNNLVGEFQRDSVIENYSGSGVDSILPVNEKNEDITRPVRKSPSSGNLMNADI